MQAVGIDTGRVYAVANNRVDLQRKLINEYEDSGLCQSIYPETIKITKVSDNKITKNMSPMDEIVLLTADENWMESENAQNIYKRLKELRNEIGASGMSHRKSRKGRKVTVYQGDEKREYPSFGKCAEGEILTSSSVRYWIDKGVEDGKGRLFETED